LLGPLAVDPDYRNRGVGTALMRRAIARARLAGHGAILLVGDATYYGRFGFSAALTSNMWMPGEYERDRLLALELKPGALADASGPISAKVTAVAKTDANTAIAVRRGKRRALLQHAA
jgi:predicted N-acetyltransferase YhbS